MSELDVALTDFLLCGLCGVLAWRTPKRCPLPLAHLYVSLALTSFLGGVVHLLPPASELRSSLWWVTLASLGIVACMTYRCAWAAWFPRSPQRIDAILAIGFLIYLLVISLWSQSFAVAVASYLPGVLLLAASLGGRYLLSRDTRWLIALSGIALTIVAAGIQTMKWGLHPVYMSHNALYHLVQAVGLILLFSLARIPAEDASERTA